MKEIEGNEVYSCYFVCSECDGANTIPYEDLPDTPCKVTCEHCKEDFMLVHISQP